MIRATRRELEARLHAAADDPLAQSASPSLLLDRHLRHAADGEGESRDAVERLSEIAKRSLARIKPLYTPAYERWRSTFGEAERQVYRTQSRLLVGFGGHHVLETGLTLHRTYGAPVVPGTALKGLAAHYCHQIWGESDPRFRGAAGEEGEFYRVLFGARDESGLVRFHDAWMLPDSLATALRDDVLTPHHGDYYGGGSEPPADYDDPVPVRFLSVSGKFLVTITCNSPHDAAGWRSLAQSLVAAALQEFGVGGKTNQGYGRLILESP